MRDGKQLLKWGCATLTALAGDWKTFGIAIEAVKEYDDLKAVVDRFSPTTKASLTLSSNATTQLRSSLGGNITCQISIED